MSDFEIKPEEAARLSAALIRYGKVTVKTLMMAAKVSESLARFWILHLKDLGMVIEYDYCYWLCSAYKRLDFKNCVHNEGLNVTVRYGFKWDELVNVGDRVIITDNHLPKYLAKIEGKTTKSFEMIEEYEIRNEHDPECRTYDGLFQVMKKTYPTSLFTELSICTLLTYRIVGRI